MLYSMRYLLVSTYLSIHIECILLGMQRKVYCSLGVLVRKLDLCKLQKISIDFIFYRISIYFEIIRRR